MQIHTRQWTLQQLIAGRKIGMEMEEARASNPPENALYVPRYQRSEAWQSHQMRMLVDSIMRGYGLSPIYLRKENSAYKIIDGQQRLNALCYFESGFIRHMQIKQGHPVMIRTRFPQLYNPADVAHGTRMKLPRDLQKACDWGGLFFSEFSDSLKSKFLNTKLSVCIITECEYDEECDFFIRLQGGKPLAPQEVRDAWRGDFCENMLRIGGKPKLNLLGETTYDGHEFFPKVARFNPARDSDRGQTRQLAAQMLMLFLARTQYSPDSFTSINAGAIDTIYGGQAVMEANAAEPFISVLGEISDVFIPEGVDLGERTYEPIHMLLFADMLLGGFSPKWKESITSAFGRFMEIMDGIEEIPSPDDLKDENFRDVWHYFRMTKTQIHQASTIRDRHALFARQMLRLLGESAEAYSETEGFVEALYYRNKKVCQQCGERVEWPDADFQQCDNHDPEMSCPNLRNHALVHRACKP